MADLRIPKKTVDDYFVLKEFQDDFNALNTELSNKTDKTDVYTKEEVNNLLKDIDDIQDDFNDLNNEIAETKEELTNLKNTKGTIDSNLNVYGDIKLFNTERVSNSEGDTILSSSGSGKFIYFRPGGVNNANGQVVLKENEFVVENDLVVSGNAVLNGDIKLPRGFALCGTINGNRDALIYQSSQPDDNGRVIVGSSGQTTQIASQLRPEVYWNLQTHQIILDSDFVSNKSQNGYAKLPNGLILQWGKGSATGEYSNNGTPFKSATINFPISFPSSTLMVQTCSTFTNYYSTVESVTTSKFVARMGLTGNIHTQETTTFYWFAIGY